VRPLASNLEADWSKCTCCLCQIDKDEELRYTPTHYETNRGNNVCVMIARNIVDIPVFYASHQMPVLDPNRKDQGGDIEETLRKTMLNIIKAVDFNLARVSLKGHTNDLLSWCW
jgi:hypothetical protein